MAKSFEEIVLSIPIASDRYAISAAIFYALDHPEEFTKYAGTYGQECLLSLIRETEGA